MPRGVHGDGVGNGRTSGAENKAATAETASWPGRKRRGPRQPNSAARVVAAKALPTAATAAEVTAAAAAAAATEASRFDGRVGGNWLRRFKIADLVELGRR